MDSVTIFWTRPPTAFLPPLQMISFVTLFFFLPVFFSFSTSEYAGDRLEHLS